LYVGLFLAFVSSAFLIQSDNMLVIMLSGMTFIVALVLILRWMVRYFGKLFR
jgi:flagellar biogenesis protein FliO